MDVKIRQEAGYDLALYGLSLSYKDRASKPDDWWPFDCINCAKGEWLYDLCESCKLYNEAIIDRQGRMVKVATANSGRGRGHDKWLRQVMIWIDIEAPRYWWSEFDTYKVGTVAQSESTMHTLSKREMTLNDLEPVYNDAYLQQYRQKQINAFNERANNSKEISIQSLKHLLPEAYLQRRLVTFNYAVLRTIIEQRKNHRLPEWHTFINTIYKQCKHPELLPKREV